KVSSFLLRQGARCAGRNAAIHEQRLAGDVRAGIGRQKDNRALEVLWLAGALERDAVAEVIDPFLIFIHHRVLLGLEPAGRETVDGDAVNPPVVGQAHSKLFNTAATGAIRSEAGVPSDAGDRTDVDDAAIFP